MLTLEHALTPPDDYIGVMLDLPKRGWARVYGRHRDSVPVNLANWQYMIHYLQSNGYEEFEDWRVERSTHWAVGWCETLLVRALVCKCEEPHIVHLSGDEFWCTTCDTEPEVTSLFRKFQSLHVQMENYPILDDSFLDAGFYIFQGSLYCAPCGRQIMQREDLHPSVDSDEWPQGCSPGAHLDYPVHCSSAKCLSAVDLTTYGASGEIVPAILPTSLTPEGVQYLKDMLDEKPLDPYQAALHALWREHFAELLED